MKRMVLKLIPNAYCVKLRTGEGFLVWPGKVQPRGFEQPAIGFALSASGAWADAWVNCQPTQGREES